MWKTRETLIKRRDALRAALTGDLSLLRSYREQTRGDEVDYALDSTQFELSSQLAEVESRELAAVEKALERMRDGSYGVCEGCNSDIPSARLQALPYATSCIECQRKIEERHATISPRTASRGSFEEFAETWADRPEPQVL